jgi:hypothetical protein
MTGDNSEPEGSQRFSNIHNHTVVFNYDGEVEKGRRQLL